MRKGGDFFEGLLPPLRSDPDGRGADYPHGAPPPGGVLVVFHRGRAAFGGVFNFEEVSQIIYNCKDGFSMKMIVIKAPGFLRGALRAIFRIK
jgi:hypothetical protein